MGRKPTYSEKVKEAILERIAAGESLRSVCRDDGMPTTGLVRKWALQDIEGFGKRYALARTECAYSRLDQAFDRIDDIPTYVDESGNKRLDAAGVNQARLYCDMAKWEASKLIPEYNDKVMAELTGKNGGALEIRWASPDELTPEDREAAGCGG